MSRGSVMTVFSERQDVALELLGAARVLSGEAELVSVVAGSEASTWARQHIACGAARSFVIPAGDGPDAGGAHVDALEHVLNREKPEIVLVGATEHGTEVAARLAQRLRLGCASDCTGLTREEDRLVVERVCLGRFVSRQVIESRPALATVQPRRFAPPDPDPGRVGQTIPLATPGTDGPVRVVETHERDRGGVPIDKADVVVGVGRGLRNRDDLRMIEELARSLGGVVGASRPLTDDLRWLPADNKIGLSGVTVVPRLYIACGISGQIEHLVGMRESGVVVAINSDPAAPILQHADYCVTGDLYEIVPALVRVIAERRREKAVPSQA